MLLFTNKLSFISKSALLSNIKNLSFRSTTLHIGVTPKVGYFFNFDSIYCLTENSKLARYSCCSAESFCLSIKNFIIIYLKQDDRRCIILPSHYLVLHINDLSFTKTFTYTFS